MALQANIEGGTGVRSKAGVQEQGAAPHGEREEQAYFHGIAFLLWLLRDACLCNLSREARKKMGHRKTAAFNSHNAALVGGCRATLSDQARGGVPFSDLSRCDPGPTIVFDRLQS